MEGRGKMSTGAIVGLSIAGVAVLGIALVYVTSAHNTQAPAGGYLPPTQPQPQQTQQPAAANQWSFYGQLASSATSLVEDLADSF